jgi:putative ABC transport system permease protein
VLRWTLKSLFAEPLHLLASAAAVAGAFALVIFFEAVFAGESKQIVAYIRHSGADVWVMQKGVSNMHMATSFVRDWKGDEVKDVDGVKNVTPILYLNTVMKAGGRHWFSFVVGLDAGKPRAGPWKIAAGKRVPEKGEAVVPSVLARLAGVKPGDEILIADKRLKVSGFSQGTFSMANSVTFVTMSDLSDIMSTSGTMSYFLVDAAPGVDAADLAARIRDSVEKVEALPSGKFMDNDWNVAMQMGLEIIGMMTVIGGALAVLLTGFIVYSGISRRERELAVALALGVRPRAVYASAVIQAGWIVLCGFAMAAALVSLAVPVTQAVLPQVTLLVTAEALLRVGAAAIVVTLIASLLPARRLARVDPALAFAG